MAAGVVRCPVDGVHVQGEVVGFVFCDVVLPDDPLDIGEPSRGEGWDEDPG